MTTSDKQMRDKVFKDAERILKTIHLFLDRADEKSLAVFKECVREAFEET